MLNTIAGIQPQRQVFVDGAELSPVAGQKIWNHSPDGFEWGFQGSGPAQLALSIMLHYSKKLITKAGLEINHRERITVVNFGEFEGTVYDAVDSQGIESRIAVKLHQRFKTAWVAKFPQGQTFSYQVDVISWMKAELADIAAKHEGVVA